MLQSQLENYIDKLKYHDWYYEYSDDHRCWVKGMDERRELLLLRGELDPDYKVWNEHCPERFKCPIKS